MFAIRLFQWSDLPAVVEVINRAAEVDHDDWRKTEGELRHEFARPGYDAEASVMVALSETGQIVGVCDSIPQSDYGEWAWGAVLPAFRRRQIGRRLVQTADASLLERMPPAAPVSVDRIVSDTVTDAMRLFERLGYQPLRDHYDMRITLDQPILPAEFPDGITLRPFVPERDSRAVYDAHQEAFRDHWGHVDTPYETWLDEKLGNARFDPALWLVAVEGEKVAGLCLCRCWDDASPDLGHVDELAVRKAWRKRGLGLALLRHSFRLLQMRGFTCVRLGVDAESTSNAVDLYERAGMYRHKRYVIYRRGLR
jgi:mycothiol synthase